MALGPFRMTAATILMVEPNPGILIVARNVLSRAGYTVLAVGKLEEGIELAERQPVDAVLMDARQADPHLLSSLHSAGRIPIILTFQRGKPIGNSRDVDATQPGVAAADFLEKPFAPDRLLSTVEGVMERWGEKTTVQRKRSVKDGRSRSAPASVESDASTRAADPKSPYLAYGSPIIEATDDDIPLLLTDVPKAHAASRGDTLVSIRAIGDDDFLENEQTDIFPFAHLINQGSAESGRRTQGAALDVRTGRLADQLRTFLEIEGIDPRPEILSACLRACDTVLESSAGLHTLAATGVEPAIEGGIPELSIDQVLQLAMAVGQPARCRVAQGPCSIDLFYEGGEITFARHAGLPDGFLLGQLLIFAGAVREPQVLSALNTQRDGTRLGQRLVERGDISEQTLSSALRTQTEELVYEMVRWSSGRFAIFTHFAPPPEARTARQSLAVPHLLLEGMRRFDEWRRIQPQIGDFDALLDRIEYPSKSKLSSLNAEDREVLHHVDGRRTVAELIRSVARPTFHVYRALKALIDRRLIARVSD